MNTLIVVLGPTGVGKTKLCLTLAKHLSCSIVNADSRQIFSEIPIGTAAPTPDQLKQVNHYFVGNHSIHDYYSASLYEQDVMNLLASIFTPQNPYTILSGGSMMYIDAVCQGIDEIPTVSDEMRQKVKDMYEADGLEPLVNLLQRLDPEHWTIVDKKNPRRVIHAIEICLMTGRTYTSYRVKEKKQRPFNIVKIGLNRDRETLYARINNRVLRMVEEGLIEEAHSLLPYRHLNALNTVGYKELFAYFDGTISKEEAIRQIQSNTRCYMRKQLTWFKKDTEIKWFYPDNIKEIINYLDATLQII